MITCILREEPRQGGKDSWAGGEAVAVVEAVVVMLLSADAAQALDSDETTAPMIALTTPALNMAEITDLEATTEIFDIRSITTTSATAY